MFHHLITKTLFIEHKYLSCHLLYSSQVDSHWSARDQTEVPDDAKLWEYSIRVAEAEGILSKA